MPSDRDEQFRHAAELLHDTLTACEDRLDEERMRVVQIHYERLLNIIAHGNEQGEPQ